MMKLNYDRKVRMIWMFLNRRDHVALLLVYIVLLYNTMDTYINHFFCIKINIIGLLIQCPAKWKDKKQSLPGGRCIYIIVCI